MEIEEFDASQYKSASMFSEIMVLVVAATAIVVIAVVLIRIRSKRNVSIDSFSKIKIFSTIALNFRVSVPISKT